MASEYDALLQAPSTPQSSEYDALLASRQPPKASTQEVPQPKMGLGDLLFGKEAAENLRGAIQDVVHSIPGMAAEVPKMAYQGLKFAAGGIQEKAQVAEEALTTAKIQGQQMASDLQSPVGSREFDRGVVNMGMLAAPAIGEAVGEAVLARGKPPIQTTPITDAAVTELPKGGEINAESVPKNEEINAEGVRKEEGGTSGSGNVEQAPQGNRTDSGERPEVATAAPEAFPSISQSAEDARRAELRQLPPEAATVSQPEQRVPIHIEANDLAQSLDGRVVGSAAKEGGTPKDIDIRLTEDQIPKAIENLKQRGFEQLDSGVVSPEEARKSGKDFGEGWQRNWNFTNPETGRKVQLWHTDEGTLVPPPVSEAGQPPVTPIQAKEVTPTAETPTTTGEVTPQGQAAPPTEPPIIGKDVTKDIPDFPDDEKKIGLTKDYISEDRKARGEAPLAEQARQTNPETWDIAGSVMARNPNAGHELVASIIDNPRTLNPDEVGVLLRHRVNLSNQADLEFNRMTSESSTPSDKSDAVIKMQALNDARNQADHANDMIGTQLGRSLQFLQQLSSQDYSLSGINQMRIAAMGGKELSGTELEAFTKENAEWSREILEKDKALQNYMREQSKQESALKGYKTRLKTATTEAERRLAFSDYAPAIRRELEGDPESARLKAEYQNVKARLQDQIVKDQLANRPMWQKILGGISWAARESALSGYHTLAKLAGFSAGKLAEIPLTQTAERVWGMIPGFKEIAVKSEFGPGANAKALGKFYADFFTTGMKQAAQQLRTGTSDFKAQYGDEKIPMNYPSFFGNLHGVEKTPLRTGVAGMTRERIVSNTMEDLAAKAVSEGQDITDPIIQGAINKKAWDAGTDEILMGNNLFADSVNGLLRKMEAVQPKTGEPSATLSVMSTIAKSLITKGIVRTPANFVKQVFERTPAGLGLGIARGARAITKGVESVPIGERTAIMRLLGVGSVGSGMFLWGVADAMRPPEQRVFGGYYQPGEKRDDKDVKWGSVRIGDVTAPHYLTHNLLSEPAQMGNTLMRVALSALSKKDRTNKGLVAGMVASTLGLAEQAPIANPAVRLQKLTDPRQQSNYFGDIVRGLIPQFIQNIAEDTDKSTVGRKPSGVVETVKLGVPVLREQVQERQSRQSKNRPR